MAQLLQKAGRWRSNMLSPWRAPSSSSSSGARPPSTRSQQPGPAAGTAPAATPSGAVAPGAPAGARRAPAARAAVPPTGILACSYSCYSRLAADGSCLAPALADLVAAARAAGLTALPGVSSEQLAQEAAAAAADVAGQQAVAAPGQLSLQQWQAAWRRLAAVAFPKASSPALAWSALMKRHLEPLMQQRWADG